MTKVNQAYILMRGQNKDGAGNPLFSLQSRIKRLFTFVLTYFLSN